jgi:RNA polymerase sigma-70 factor (ECF subfamily)
MTTMEFQAAVMEHKDRVHNYARGILRDSEDARDVAQECLVRLWHHRETVEPGAGCRSWLLRSAHNLCIDRLRRRSSRPEIVQDDDAREPEDRRPNPERLAASTQLAIRLERALGDLDRRDRAIVLLREVEGLSYDEIADVLGLKLGTLKATLHRAREKLRSALTRAEVTP